MNLRNYDSKQVIGTYFEKKTMDIFGLKQTKNKRLPDLISEDDSFYVEVKASAWNNVIKEKQLMEHLKIIPQKKFYAAWFHNIWNASDYSKNELISALDCSSKKVYLLPISIIKAHFDNGLVEYHPSKKNFVRLRRNHAKKIFSGDAEFWENIKLDIKEYKKIQPYAGMFIITKNGTLEERILDSIHQNHF